MGMQEWQYGSMSYLSLHLLDKLLKQLVGNLLYGNCVCEEMSV